LIVGPFDPTGRFTYWPARFGDGGEVLGPGDPARKVQIIDARDLAVWLLEAASARIGGTFNAVTDPFAMSDLMDACTAIARNDARVTWVDDEFLLEQDIGPWMELPLWVPEQEMITPNARARAAGLKFSPLERTVHDTLEWVRGLPQAPKWPAGLDREKERAVLEAWRAR
jgi:2'-hydroxyisoflavone reductase